MEQEQGLYLLRMLLYCAAAMLSMFTFIPIAVSVVKHSGYCLFYTDDTAYGLVGVCGYTIAVPVIFSLVYGGCMAVIAFCRMLGIVDRRSEDENVKCFILNVAFDGVTFLFMFINAGLNSGGFNSLCYNLFGSLDRCAGGYLYQPIFGYDRDFYIRHKMAEVSAWLLWAVWLLQFGIGLVALRQTGLLFFHCPWFCPRPRCLCSCRVVLQRKHPQGLGHVQKPAYPGPGSPSQPMIGPPNPTRAPVPPWRRGDAERETVF